jgi:hypothetical protein
MFHVKQSSFSDAEVAENDLQNVFHVHAASEALQSAGSEPQLFG